MTFRVNARKSHSERRETLTPCLDWFSSASSRVRCSFFFFLFFSFFFLASRFFCSLFFFLRVRSVRPRYLPLQLRRRLFLPFAPIILLSTPSRLYTLSVLSFLLRTCTRVRPFLSLSPSLPLPCSVTLLLSLASRTRLSPSRFYFSPKQTSRWKRRAGGRKEGRRRKGEKRVTRQKRKKEAERE